MDIERSESRIRSVDAIFIPIWGGVVEYSYQTGGNTHNFFFRNSSRKISAAGDSCVVLLTAGAYVRPKLIERGARGDLPSLTATDAVVTPSAGGGSASPPPASSAIRSRLPRRDAVVPRSRSARLLPRRLPPLPAPAGHPPVPPRRRGFLVRRRIPRGLPLLPQANRTRNQLPQ